MFTLKLGILRVLVFFALRCKLYYMWSRLYRAINRNLAWDVALPKIGNEEELTKILATLKWAADDWTELWDAIATPQQAWATHRAGKPVGDCDEYSVISAELLRPFLSGLPFPITRGGYITILEVGILSVPWTWPGGTSGHNVCMFSYVSGSNKYWAYVGNWFGGGVRWGFHSREELIKDILKIVKGRGVNRISALGAAYVKPDLQLVKWWSAKSF